MLKQALLTAGYPAEDLAGYLAGDELPLDLLSTTHSGEPFHLRPYQKTAADLFTLIGPKRYDVPWRDLEGQGFIAAACTEIRIPQTEARQMDYAIAGRRYQFRIAAENPLKLDVVQALLEQEAGHRILIIGEYLDQLKAIAQRVDFPIITGKTSQPERDRLYAGFRRGEISGHILSRVGNFALDLPDADGLIQVSGKYGSRQEEAQRLGRVL